MDRRRLLIATGAIVAAPLVGSAGQNSTSKAAAPAEIRGSLRRLTAPGASDNRATFMPDGKTLLFASNRSGKSQIWAMDPDGTHQRRFHASAANDYGRVAPNSAGTAICFSSDREGQNAVYVLEPARGHIVRVSDLAFWSFGPTWSRHDLIAFFSRKGGNIINTWIVRPDGSDARQITFQPGESRQPWWSPDGGTLALSADQGSGSFNVWLLSLKEEDARPITHRGSYAQPFWSPDGRQIAVSAKIDELYHRIYVMSADGSNLAPIPQPEGVDNVHPAWSPDGRSIVFTSDRGAAGSIFAFEGSAKG
jgi:Tol biopolymer transport system component